MIETGRPTEMRTGNEIPRVLAIASNRAHLAVYARRLGEHGFRVATAMSASDAIAEMHRNPVDLVLSELRLAGASGVELVRMIRGDTTQCHRPVLLIAGRSDRKGALAAFEAGADGVIDKPFRFELLAARIAREIERVRAFDKLVRDNAALDARVVSRALELGEMRARFTASEQALRELELVRSRAA